MVPICNVKMERTEHNWLGRPLIDIGSSMGAADLAVLTVTPHLLAPTSRGQAHSVQQKGPPVMTPNLRHTSIPYYSVRAYEHHRRHAQAQLGGCAVDKGRDGPPSPGGHCTRRSPRALQLAAAAQ
jgi:hypothetical protein